MGGQRDHGGSRLEVGRDAPPVPREDLRHPAEDLSDDPQPRVRSGGVGKWFTIPVTCLPEASTLTIPNKLVLCRGPDLNRRHMVLQTIALPAELPRRDLH